MAYLKGVGTRQDYQKALKWYQRAANNGFYHAQYSLGYMHQMGYATTVDYKQAIKWYRRAARQGSLSAHASLIELRNAGYIDDLYVDN